MKKLICLALALILCLGLLVGCGAKEEVEEADDGVSAAVAATGAEVGQLNTSGSSTSESIATPPPADAKYQDTFIALIDDKVALINPFNPGGKCSQQGNVYHMMYDTLIDWNLAGEYVPCLATEWSCNEDATVWNLKLRDDVYFHNDEQFTADDIIFTWQYGLEALGTGIYDRCKTIKDITAVNDFEINMTLFDANPDFEYDMSTITGFVICNREAVEADPENGPMIGTGPYYVSEFVTSESITYSKWDKYFGEEKPITNTIIFRYVAEETARYIMLENAEADSGSVNGVYIPQFAQNPQFVMSSFCVNNCGYIALNCSRQPMDDVNFRWACAYAVSRDEIVDVGFSGYSQKHMTGGIWGWNTAYANPDIPDIEQDVEKAKEFLAKSNYDGHTLQIFASMPHTKKIAAVVMSELTAVGINCEVCEVDGPTLTLRSKFDSNDMDIIINSAMFGPTAQNVRFEVEKTDNNKACWVNEEAIELCAKAGVTPNGPERQELYYRIQQIMFDEQPYIPTTHNALYGASQAGTGGIKFFSNAFNDFSTAYRIIED